jgi:DNA-binding XRE family transcriptional regulator
MAMTIDFPSVRYVGAEPAAKPARRGRPRLKRRKKIPPALLALGGELVRHREKHGLTQRELAAKAGCSWQIISHTETGACGPSREVYIALRRILEAQK